MKINIEDIRRQYVDLSDEGLLEIDREDLMDQARQCYDEELARRKLNLPAANDPVAAPPVLQDEPEEEAAGGEIDTSYIRHGVGAVRPYVYGGLDLPDFVFQVFGALELERNEFTPTAFHVEVMIGDSVIALEASDPPDEEGTPSSIYVYVEDVDETYARAIAAGGVSLASPEDKPYDERSAGVKDSFGNTWWISTYTGV